MKHFIRMTALLTAMCLFAAACNKDDEGTFHFNESVAYFDAGETREIGFTVDGYTSVSVSGTLEGWSKPEVDMARRVVKITAPAADTEGAVWSGAISFTAYNNSDDIALSASLFVSVSESVDLTDEPANCYILNASNTNYTVDLSRTGDDVPLATASAALVWQSTSKLVRHLSFNADAKTCSFYVSPDDDGNFKAGNALLGGYDDDGNLLWCWHLWIAEYDPDAAGGTVIFNGSEMMTRNLGALASSNGTTDNILASFGLYYQWGRPTPFIGPSTYFAGNGASATMYDIDGKTVELSYEPSSAEIGTVEYARTHPLTFITGGEESRYDWMWSKRDNLWGASANENNPCPRGWRVASPQDYANLQIVEPLAGVDAGAYFDKYGWTLTDGASQSLFMGAGRRRYTDGKFQNIYVNPDDERETRNAALYDQPWVGNYWCSAVSGSDAAAFTFFFDKAHVENSAVEDQVAHHRANAMPVRCVRAE